MVNSFHLHNCELVVMSVGGGYILEMNLISSLEFYFCSSIRERLNDDPISITFFLDHRVFFLSCIT